MVQAICYLSEFLQIWVDSHKDGVLASQIESFVEEPSHEKGVPPNKIWNGR